MFGRSWVRPARAKDEEREFGEAENEELELLMERIYGLEEHYEILIQENGGFLRTLRMGAVHPADEHCMMCGKLFSLEDTDAWREQHYAKHRLKVEGLRRDLITVGKRSGTSLLGAKRRRSGESGRIALEEPRKWKRSAVGVEPKTPMDVDVNARAESVAPLAKRPRRSSKIADRRGRYACWWKESYAVSFHTMKSKSLQKVRRANPFATILSHGVTDYGTSIEQERQQRQLAESATFPIDLSTPSTNSLLT